MLENQTTKKHSDDAFDAMFFWEHVHQLKQPGSGKVTILFD